MRHALFDHVHFFVVVDLEDPYCITSMLRLHFRLIRRIFLELVHEGDFPVLLRKVGPVPSDLKFGTGYTINKRVAMHLNRAFSLPASIERLHQRHQGLVSVIQKIRVIICFISLIPKALLLRLLWLLRILKIFQLIILINRDLRWPVHFECKHERRSLLGYKYFGFFCQNIKNSIVSYRLVHKRNVDLRGQALIDLNQLRFNKLLFFLLCSIFEHIIRQIGQCLDKARGRQICIHVVFALLLVWHDIGLDC